MRPCIRFAIDQELNWLRSGRLRLFPRVLWKSCTRFGAKSRRFDESGEKLKGSLWKSAVEMELGVGLERWNCTVELERPRIFGASRKS